MIACYEYVIESTGMFKVIKRWVVDDKPKMAEYLVSYRKKEWYCDCKGYQVHKHCKHIFFIKSQIKEEDLGILRLTNEIEEFEWKKHLKVKE